MSPAGRSSLEFLREALVFTAYSKTPPANWEDTADWNEIERIAEEHSISGSIYSFLKTLPGTPAPLLDRFRERSIQAIAQAEFACEALCDLRDVLAGNGPCVILQGLSLLETVYPPHVARFLGDIDLFLPRADWNSLYQGLREKGFRPWLNYSNVWKRDGLTLDLHPTLWGEDRIQSRADLTPGVPEYYCASSRCPGFSLLPAEWMLTHTIYHTAKHGFSKLLWDLDLLLLRSTLDLTLALPVAAARLVRLARGRIEMLRSPESRPRLGLGIMQDITLRKIMKGAGKSWLGEIALSALAPTWRHSLSYLAHSAFPGRRTLMEMYGARSGPSIFLARIRSLLNRRAS